MISVPPASPAEPVGTQPALIAAIAAAAALGALAVCLLFALACAVVCRARVPPVGPHVGAIPTASSSYFSASPARTRRLPGARGGWEWVDGVEAAGHQREPLLLSPPPLDGPYAYSMPTDASMGPYYTPARMVVPTAYW